MSTDQPRWTPTTAAAQTVCRNCESPHTRQYVRVYGSNDNILWHCHDCDEPAICGRDMKQGAGTTPDYDPATDRGKTSGKMPLFDGGSDR